MLLLLTSLVMNGQDLDYAKSVVKKLSAPDMFGRGYVKDGNKLTADFIIGEFEKFKLDPKVQKFTTPVNTYPGKMMVAIDGQELVPAREFLVEPQSPSVKGRFPIVVTSRKGINTKAKFISILRKSNGSFIFIDNSKVEGEDKELTKTINDFINYIRYSDKCEAKGLLLYSSDKLSWRSSVFDAVRPAIQINKKLDINKIKSIKVNIKAVFKKEYKTQNIICNIKGKSDQDSTVVFTAHYDHLGMFGSSTPFPGANDNASGIALLLNLAKYYAENQPEHNVVLIAFSANELNLGGSRHFLDNPTIELSKIKFLINFDIVGTGGEGINTVNGRVFTKQFSLLESININKKYLPKIDKRGKACNSDHCFFTEKDIPCFFIYTQGGIKAYHDLDDRSEILPLTKFVELFKLMVDFEEQL